MDISSAQREFSLPDGLRESLRSGAPERRHRVGALLAASAKDEMRVLQDFRVYLRPESFLHLMLARTITRLGDLERVDVSQVETLSRADLAVLEETYRELNGYAAGSSGRGTLSPAARGNP